MTDLEVGGRGTIHAMSSQDDSFERARELAAVAGIEDKFTIHQLGRFIYFVESGQAISAQASLKTLRLYLVRRNHNAKDEANNRLEEDLLKIKNVVDQIAAQFSHLIINELTK